MKLKTIVCVKAVPANLEPSRVIENRGLYPLEARNAFINESDEYALEEALAIKQQHGGEVVAVTIGSAASQEVLYKALAKGADRAVRIDTTVLSPTTTALMLATLIKREPYDLILTGVESSDVMASCVAAGIAAHLNILFAFAVTHIEIAQNNHLILTKEIGGSRTKRIEIGLPAVLSVQSGIRPLTYTAYSRLVFARRRPIQVLKLTDFRIEEELRNNPEWDIEAVYVPEETGKTGTVMLEGKTTESVKRILEIVKNKMFEA
jgi:electron transfer flavoprotein beta subunit